MKKHQNYKFKSLKNFEIPFDVEKEWEVLFSKLDKKNKRKRFLYFVLPLSICIGVSLPLAYFYYFQQLERRALFLPSHQCISAPNSNSPQTTIPLPQSPTSSNLVSDTDQIREFSVIDPRFSGLVEPTLATAKTSKPEQNEGKIGLKHTAKLADSDIKLTLDQEASLRKEVADLQNSEFGQNYLDKSSDDFSDFESIDLPKKIEDTSSLSAHTPFANRLIALALLPPKLFSEISNFQLSSLENRIKPAKKHKFRPWFLSLHGGVGLPDASYLSQNSEYLDYKDHRENTEKSLESIHTGVSFGKFIHRRWYLSTGVQWHRINERLDYTNNLLKVYQISGQPLSIYENYKGEIDIEYGTVEKKSVINIQKRKFNFFKSYSVPLKIGYMMTLGDVDLFIESGILYQFSSYYHGQILDHDLLVYDIKEVMTVKSRNFWIENSLGIYQNINYNHILGLNVAWRNTLSSINKDEGLILQNFNDVSVGLKVLKLL